MRGSASGPMRPIEWLLLVILSVLWSGAFFFSKVAVAELAPFTLMLGRVGIAALALNLLAVVTGQRMPTSPRIWASFLAMGALNNLIPFSLVFWGQTQIPSGLASILNATTPLWTVLLAHWLTRDERLSAGRMGGVLLGLAGVAVMIGPDLLGGLRLSVLGELAIVGATLSYALARIFGKRFRGLSPYVVATGQVTGTTIMVIPIALSVDRPWQQPAPGAITWGALIGLGLLSTAIAYVIYFRLLATAGATNVLLVTLLIPVSATLLGAAFLGERLDPRHMTGMGLIALGLAAIDGRLLALLPARLRRARPAPPFGEG